MVSPWVLGLGLVSALGAETPAPAPDVESYRAAEAKVGRDADSHVKLALWCEAHGLSAERVRHLAIAVLIDPKNTAARGLMGLVEFGGKWQRPDAVSEKVKSDEALTAALAEYNGRRARMAETADAHWRLAVWCEQKGLKAEAIAHFTAVTRLEPGREAAWKRLGYRKHGGRWVTDAQLAAEKAEADAQKQADKTWKPLLAKWHGWLGDRRRRPEAEEALNAVTDPRAVPSIWAVFANGGPADQARAVVIFGRIDAPAATRALGFLAVFSNDVEVRRAATESLKQRDPRDVVGWLIAMLRAPMKYEVRPVGGPGSPGALFVEGEKFNVQRLYAPPPLPNIPLFPGEPITFDAAGLPVVTRYLGPSVERHTSTTGLGGETITMEQYIGRAPVNAATAQLIQESRNNPQSVVVPNVRNQVTLTRSSVTTTETPEETTIQIPIGQIMLQYQLSALSAQKQLADDVATVDLHNLQVKQSNERVGQVLRGITGHDQGEDQQAWAAWWTDQLGYAYKPPQSYPKPTVVENVPLDYLPQPVPVVQQTTATGPTTTTTRVSAAGSFHGSCFKAGTPVLTLTGTQSIESIRVGDRVLTQDTTTGNLSYQPVVAVYHNSPALTYAVDLGGEVVSATGIHRFWKSGHGWVMARDLKAGDRVRTLDGAAEVKSVETESVVPVFNLEVSGGESFFVGGPGLLVHDNSLVKPVTDPFDAEPDLSAVAQRGR